MSANEVYGVEMKGNGDVINGMQGIAQAAATTTKQVNSGSEDAKAKSIGLADAFKAVKRDITSVGGESAAVFAGIGDDVFSIAEKIGEGGLMGPVALLSAGIGGIAFVWHHVMEEAQNARKAQADAIDGINKQREAALGLMAANREVKGEAGVQTAKDAVTIAERQLEIAKDDTANSREKIAMQKSEIENRGFLATLTANNLKDIGLHIALEKEHWQNVRNVITLESALASARQAEIDAEKRLWQERTKAAVLAEQDTAKLAQLENAGIDGSIANIKRKAALDTATTRDKTEALLETTRLQNAQDQNTLKGNEQASNLDRKIMNEKIANRNAETQAAVRALQDQAFAAAKQRELDLENYRQSLVNKHQADKLSEAEAINRADFDVGARARDMAKQSADFDLQQKQAAENRRHADAQRVADIAGIGEAERLQHEKRMLEIDVEIQHKEYADKRAALIIEKAQGLTDDQFQQLDTLNEQLMEKRIAAREQEYQAAKNSIEMEIADRVRLQGLQAYGAGVNIAYSASQMVVSATTDILTSKLRALGDVNRENMADFFKFGNDAPAQAAKAAQGIVAGIAAEAAAKSVFEGAEAIKETALGLGSLAAYDVAGAENHFTSAATHVAGAAAYGALAGGGAGVALAIGSQRGAGGLVGLTKEEKEAQANKTKADQMAAGGRFNGSTGTGVGGGQATVQVTNTTVFMAGAMDASNRRNLAGAVGVGYQEMRRDGYAQRDIERGAP